MILYISQNVYIFLDIRTSLSSEIWVSARTEVGRHIYIGLISTHFSLQNDAASENFELPKPSTSNASVNSHGYDPWDTSFTKMMVCQIWLTDFRVLASTLKKFGFCYSYFRLQSIQLEYTEKCVIHLCAEVQLSSQLSKRLLCWLRTMWIYTWNWGITHPGLCS